MSRICHSRNYEFIDFSWQIRVLDQLPIVNRSVDSFRLKICNHYDY